MPLDEPLLIVETQPVVEGKAEVLHGLERLSVHGNRGAEEPTAEAPADLWRRFMTTYSPQPGP
jgi:hypothetical protein